MVIVSPEVPQVTDIKTSKPIEQTDGEISKNLPIAVEIAIVRTELEGKIFKPKEILPEEQWGETYETTMAEHPRLGVYRRAFDEAFLNASKANKDVGNIWNYAYKRVNEIPPMGLYEKASPQASAILCDLLLDFKPVDSPRAIRGPITIRIVLSDNDYKRYREVNGWVEEYDGHFETNKEVPLIVMSESISSGDDGPISILHELEHAKYHLLDMALTVTDRLYINRLYIPDQLAKTLDRHNSNQYSLFKNEFLAYTTELEPYSAEELSRDEIVEFFFRLGEEMSKEGVYIKARAGIDSGRYATVVRNSAMSFSDAYFFFLDNYPGLNPARLSINFFSQFPAEKWPAAARLLKTKHRDFQ